VDTCIFVQSLNSMINGGTIFYSWIDICGGYVYFDIVNKVAMVGLHINKITFQSMNIYNSPVRGDIWWERSVLCFAQHWGLLWT
jgi:hypothetical protein